MGKKDKNTVLDDYEKLKNEIIRDKVNEIFRNHPKDYIAKMEEIGFSIFPTKQNLCFQLICCMNLESYHFIAQASQMEGQNHEFVFQLGVDRKNC
jgi:hypothetical protein